jgi:hypothetical protein
MRRNYKALLSGKYDGNYCGKELAAQQQAIAGFMPLGLKYSMALFKDRFIPALTFESEDLASHEYC